jgi:hypothetical protein
MHLLGRALRVYPCELGMEGRAIEASGNREHPQTIVG